jgi:hypothetical protein
VGTSGFPTKYCDCLAFFGMAFCTKGVYRFVLEIGHNDKTMLKLVGNRIHKNLLYIGLNDSSYTNVSETRIGPSGVDSILLNLTFATPQKEVTVYDNVLNELKYADSMCSLVYDPFGINPVKD